MSDTKKFPGGMGEETDDKDERGGGGGERGRKREEFKNLSSDGPVICVRGHFDDTDGWGRFTEV